MASAISEMVTEIRNLLLDLNGSEPEGVEAGKILECISLGSLSPRGKQTNKKKNTKLLNWKKKNQDDFLNEPS